MGIDQTQLSRNRGRHVAALAYQTHFTRPLLHGKYGSPTSLWSITSVGPGFPNLFISTIHTVCRLITWSVISELLFGAPFIALIRIVGALIQPLSASIQLWAHPPLPLAMEEHYGWKAQAVVGRDG